MIEINIFKQSDTDDIIKLVLHCQNDGTRPLVTVNDQPDLLHIKEEYIDTGGNFWVAKDKGKLAGTIGLYPCGNNTAILKKFFVYEEYRGIPHHLGQKLYFTLLDFAKEKGIKTIILDTPKNTERAHKFYIKAGFKSVKKEDLPLQYSYPYADSDFFMLQI